MRLVIGSDHAGWPLKQAVIDHIHSLGHEVVDVGSYDEKPVDFPDIARAVAKKVTSGDVARGIMVCGTGVGASIATNKMKGIRAASVTMFTLRINVWNMTTSTSCALAPKSSAPGSPTT